MLRGILAALAILAFGAPAYAAFGSGSRTVTASIAGRSGETKTFSIYTYRPSCSSYQGIAFIHHGVSRNADSYRDAAIQLAKAECLLIVAPLYTEGSFPSDSYQRGGVAVDDGGPLAPESAWGTRFVAGMIAWARAQAGDPNAPYALYGHSAGGQFLARVAAYEATDNSLPAGLERIVVANPSTWVRASGVDQDDGAPVDLNVSYDAIPYGFEGFPNRVQNLKEYLALPITVYIGSNDTVRDSDLATGSYADAQGQNRRKRAENAFAEAQAAAAALGVPFNWTKVYANGCGHSNGCMLKNSSADNAFGLE